MCFNYCINTELNVCFIAGLNIVIMTQPFLAQCMNSSVAVMDSEQPCLWVCRELIAAAAAAAAHVSCDIHVLESLTLKSKTKEQRRQHHGFVQLLTHIILDCFLL